MPMLQDDRGELRPVIVPEAVTFRPVSFVWPGEAEGPWLAAAMYVVGCVMMASAVVGVFMARGPWEPIVLAAALALGVLGVVVLRMPRTFAVGIARSRHIVDMLVRGTCPACGAAIDQGGVEDDGCLVCASCGGAWRVVDR